MILVSALGALGGVYLWLFYDRSNPVSAVITLALGALCAALLLLAVAVIAGIVRLSRGPALVIDDDGIVVRTTLSSVGFIPWEQTLAFLPMRTRVKNSVHDYVFILFADFMWPWDRCPTPRPGSTP